MKQVDYDVVVLGAGAAGLFCAAQAGLRGRRVLVLDHANKPGKKILMSGGGRCNFTNYYVEPDRYLSHNPHFCKSALSRYTQWDFIALVEQYGIGYHEKTAGQLFCDDKASAILAMLLDECTHAGVQVQLSTSIQALEALDSDDARYRLTTSQGVYTAHSVVIATGGPSIPTLGASGFGYDIARQFGLNVYPHRPGLVPLTVTDHFREVCQRLSGTSLTVDVACGDRIFRDDLLFTHRGLSGPAILQISSYWQMGDVLSINLLPNQEVLTLWREQQHARPKVQVKTWLAEWLTQKLADEWAGDLATRPLSSLSIEEVTSLSERLHHWTIKPAGTEGYRTAEVALGGVDTDELSSKTMESVRQPGLFFIGEVVDVTGHLGGFNFQWAWSSAYASAQYV